MESNWNVGDEVVVRTLHSNVELSGVVTGIGGGVIVVRCGASVVHARHDSQLSPLPAPADDDSPVIGDDVDDDDPSESLFTVVRSTFVNTDMLMGADTAIVWWEGVTFVVTPLDDDPGYLIGAYPGDDWQTGANPTNEYRLVGASVYDVAEYLDEYLTN